MSSIPDHSDLWWGLPPRAVSDAVAAIASTPKPSHVTPIESDVIVSLSAAYPSLRRQVLESVVEDVARALHVRMFPAGQTVGWDNLIEDSRESWRQRARAALGLEDRT